MHDSSKNPCESLVLSCAERVMWEDPTLQPSKLRSSWECGLWLGRSQTSNAPHRHESGHRCSSHVSTPADMRTRGVKSSGGHESTPVTGRPAGAAAGDVPTVTRHAVERKEVIMVLAISGAHCKWAAARASVHLLIQFHTCLIRRSRGHTHHRLQWKAASIQVEKELAIFLS